ncbi:MAG: ATP-dependent RecD-like DNA helicase [Oscillospiraceae bacterium]|jgi:exodeoxyribonuclease V alpha subunit|nr:ATP-dependent RecD-like DNA helicase [Oscillospiraceae bacterium]
MSQYSTIDGTVLNLIFQNEENGYTVLRLVTTDGEVVTVVGCIPCAAPGENLICAGSWMVHPQHGEQFKAEEVERHLPTSETEILSYLSSGAVKGVGPATAQRMVDRFGADTLRVLEEEPERIAEIRGITAKKAKEIAEAFRYQTGMRRLLEFLSLNDLPLPLSMRLYRRYGLGAMEAVRANPYLLVDECYGVGFQQMDAIALGMGFEGDSGRRLEAAVLYELSYNAGNGHVFLPRDKLLGATCALLQIEGREEAALIEEALDGLIARRAVVSDMVGRVEAIYLCRLWEAEVTVAERLRTLLSFPADQGRRVEALIDRIEAEQGVTYAAGQRRAVALSAAEGVLLLTGGPGTGKTTSVRGIVALFDSLGLDMALMAPTGRAAKRMSELTGREAQTIHRALGMSYNEQTGEVSFSKNEKEPLEADAVIVDEMSMVDLPLMRALLTALRPGCRLVMVGDPDQLPSVGPGNVFGDLIRSGAIQTVALTEIFRQARQSAIVRNAHAINLGSPPCLDSNQGDFFFLCRRAPDRIVDTVVGLCQTRLPENMGVPQSSIQVLCPTRRGPWGTETLNRALQAALNPPSPEKRERTYGELVFRVGDRVMQTKNNYDVLWDRPDGTVGTGIFNGDVGQVVDIDPSGELVTLCFDERTAVYTTEMLGELDMAYAMTVHKAQGSEYQAVVLAAGRCASSLMVRGVLYTAITRARELLVVVGDDAALLAMAANDKQQRRYSGLRRRLKRAAKQDAAE